MAISEFSLDYMKKFNDSFPVSRISDGSFIIKCRGGGIIRPDEYRKNRLLVWFSDSYKANPVISRVIADLYIVFGQDLVLVHNSRNDTVLSIPEKGLYSEIEVHKTLRHADGTKVRVPYTIKVSAVLGISKKRVSSLAKKARNQAQISS